MKPSSMLCLFSDRGCYAGFLGRKVVRVSSADNPASRHADLPGKMCPLWWCESHGGRSPSALGLDLRPEPQEESRAWYCKPALRHGLRGSRGEHTTVVLVPDTLPNHLLNIYANSHRLVLFSALAREASLCGSQ